MCGTCGRVHGASSSCHDAAEWARRADREELARIDSTPAAPRPARPARKEPPPVYVSRDPATGRLVVVDAPEGAE